MQGRRDFLLLLRWHREGHTDGLANRQGQCKETFHLQ